MPAALLIARVEPVSIEAAVAFAGLALFGALALAGARVGRLLPLAVVVLTLAAWLFGAVHLWSFRKCSMAETVSCGEFEHVANDPVWTAQLMLAIVGAALAGLAQRLLMARHVKSGATCLALAVVGFLAWGWIAKVLDVCVAGAAVLALMVVLASRPPPSRPAGYGPAIGIGVLAATIGGVLWMSLAFIVVVAVKTKDVRDCRCWADDANAWQLAAEFWLALGGAGLLVTATAVAARGKRARAVACAGGAAALLVPWLLIILGSY